ncbi:nuclear transport factor 2 family protein [Lysinibacillus antri]|uniref:Nuclear transport factor 2 family protein n=1 Tax=Lysinibacillus antri TaxID=2498145 RepID=A0A3S0RWH9_9BACI|nr:nuclear transport factor 2 family protein [Lysinibacillus antri]RUL54176.1 nuclear transport factor 2 family protein [Lysinibacillus antri]
MKKWLMLVVAALMLTACGDKEETKKEETTKDETLVGFELTGDEVEEAPDVPKEDEEQIIAAFNEYIDSFNAKDIDRYTQTLSKNPQGFEYEEDVAAAKNAFAQYNIERTPSDVTIVKYSEDEAQVFSNLEIQMTEIETNAELTSSGRQVTVFTNENGGWKVTSVYYIGNDS